MFKVIYLPTAEIVPITEYRPEGLLGRESGVRAYMESHVCIFSIHNTPMFLHTEDCRKYDRTKEVPLHLLEVIEVS